MDTETVLLLESSLTLLTGRRIGAAEVRLTTDDHPFCARRCGSCPAHHSTLARSEQYGRQEKSLLSRDGQYGAKHGARLRFDATAWCPEF